MIRLTVEGYEDFVILVIDNANTIEDEIKFIDDYFERIDQFAKSSSRVLFKIDDLDSDGVWHDFARFWLARKETIHFVYRNEEILSTIILLFGPEATFHKTVEEAIRTLK